MFKQKGNPFKVTPCGRRRNYMTSPFKTKKTMEKVVVKDISQAKDLDLILLIKKHFKP